MGATGDNTLVQSACRPRVLLAKIGLDGHDRGVKVLARSFRDAGIDVIYTGLWQTPQATMYAAMQEDADVVGVSLLSAAHMTVMPEMIRLRREIGAEHIPLVLGGIVPEADHPALLNMGIAAIFNPGSPLDGIINAMNDLAGQHQPVPIEELRKGYEAGDPRALAKLLTALQRGEDLGGWAPPAGRATVIGVTGAPGVGKSSFISRLGRALRERDKKVAVVAIDPSSPITGGALLGDRLRMMHGEPDADFFIRSMSSGNVLGGLGPHCKNVIEMMSGFGFDYVLLETVGAGQADVSVREITDKTVLLLMPQSGDSIQFSKAGIMEIADCFVINKCDLPGADATEGQLRSSVGDSRPIYRITAIRDIGISAVADWAVGLARSD